MHPVMIRLKSAMTDRLCVWLLCLLLPWDARSTPLPPKVIRFEERFLNSISNDHNHNLRPNDTTRIVVSAPTIMDVRMAEATNSIEVMGYFSLSWEDSRLKRDWQHEYDIPVTSVPTPVPTHLLWTPDIINFIPRSTEDVAIFTDPSVVAYVDGSVTYTSYTRLRSPCRMDLKLWPQDTYTCSFKMGSAKYHGYQVDFVVEGEIEHSEMEPSISGWEILTADFLKRENYYACCDEPYPVLHLDVTVRRHVTESFLWIPVFSLLLLTLMVFLLPPDAGEKVTLGGFCLVLDFLFFSYVSCATGFSPSQTPVIVMLAIHLFSYTASSVMVSVVVVRLARGPHPSPLSSCCRYLIPLATCLCLGNYSAMIKGYRAHKSDSLELSHAHNEEARPSTSQKNHAHEYHLLLAAVLDRIMFILYLCVCLKYSLVFWGVV